VDDAVRLGRRGEVVRGGCGPVERVAHDPVAPAAREHRTPGPRPVPGVPRAADRPISEYSPSLFSRTISMSMSAGPRPASGECDSLVGRARSAGPPYVWRRGASGAQRPRSPGAGPADIDMLIVRENNEGEYRRSAGACTAARRTRSAVQESVFTRRGCDRVMRYAFELAAPGPAPPHLGDQVERHHPQHALLGRALRRDGRSTPDVQNAQDHIDILTAHSCSIRLVRVVVASNCSATSCPTSPAIAARSPGPGRQHQPGAEYPSMFEPYTAPPPTSPAGASLTRSPRSGRVR